MVDDIHVAGLLCFGIISASLLTYPSIMLIPDGSFRQEKDESVAFVMGMNTKSREKVAICLGYEYNLCQSQSSYGEKRTR